MHDYIRGMARPRKGDEKNATAGVAVRVTPGLRADLDSLARENGRTITDEIRVTLAQNVESARDNRGRAT